MLRAPSRVHEPAPTQVVRRYSIRATTSLIPPNPPRSGSSPRTHSGQSRSAVRTPCDKIPAPICSQRPGSVTQLTRTRGTLQTEQNSILIRNRILFGRVSFLKINRNIDQHRHSARSTTTDWSLFTRKTESVHGTARLVHRCPENQGFLREIPSLYR